MADYSFQTIWQFQAPLQDVWDAIVDTDLWPTWWRGVEKVELIRKGDQNDIGTVKRYTWKSKLPYRLVFDMRTTRIERYSVIEGVATGELDGNGLWTFSHANGVTTARYDWNIVTTKRWMNLLAPIAKPFFQWNHDVVMEWGRVCLAKKLHEPRST
jgi:uncharacterized protein YndB with AHSA1/START domain